MKTSRKKIIGMTILCASFLCGRFAYSQVNPCYPPPSGIAAWYQAETNTHDHINSNDGTWAGTASYTNGEVNQAFNFNGSSYITVPDSSTLHFTNAMSAEAWINLHSVNTGFSANEIVSKFGPFSANQNSWTMSVDSSRHPYFTVVSTNYTGGGTATSTNAISLDQWVHIAGTYDGSVVKIYVNGQLSGATAYTEGIFHGTYPMSIGCTLDSFPNSLFHGQIDEVSLYNRALTDCEVESIYVVGTRGKCP